jgi:hypothetical protein
MYYEGIIMHKLYKITDLINQKIYIGINKSQLKENGKSYK